MPMQMAVLRQMMMVIGQRQVVMQVVQVVVVVGGRCAEVARTLRRRRTAGGVAVQVQRAGHIAGPAAAQYVGDHEARARRQHGHRSALHRHGHSQIVGRCVGCSTVRRE